MSFNPDDLTTAAKTRPGKSSAKKQGTGIASIIVGLFVIFFAIKSCVADRNNRATDDAIAMIITQAQKNLPSPYRDGLMFETVTLDNKRIIMTIRNPNLTLEQAKTNPTVLSQIQASEKKILIQACQHADTKLAIDNSIETVRRFVDKDNKLLFEVTLDASDCR